MSKVFLFTSIVIFHSSCATLLHGNKEKMVFESRPQGAKVYINDRFIAKTPFYTKLDVRNIYMVYMEKDSVKSLEFRLAAKNHVLYMVLDIAAAATIYLSPILLVDYLSGSLLTFNKDCLYVDFEKKIQP